MRYNLSASMSDRANYDQYALNLLEEYVCDYEGPFSEIDDNMIENQFDPELVDDQEEGKARFMDIWRDLRARIKEEATPKPARLVSLPLTYESPVIDDNGGEPDGDGDWLVPIERFDDDEDLQAALISGGKIVEGWRVRYNTPAYAHEVRGRWSGFQSEEEAYAESLDVAQEIADWCCRRPPLR